MPSLSSLWSRTLAHLRVLVEAPSRRALWITFGACVLVGLGARLAFPSGLPGAAALVHESVLLLGFAALWIVAQSFFERRPASPLRTLGTLVAAGLGFALLSGLVHLTGAFSSRRAGGLLMYGLSLLEVGLGLLLLLQLRRLVLYRRTRTTQRNWRLMTMLIAFTALTAFGRPPGSGLGPLQTTFVVLTVGMMMANVFRLSWIVGLSLREKMTGAALSVGVLVTIGVLSNVEVLGGNVYEALEQHSFSLSVFVLLACVFGILYSVTTLLSLLFHLPTTGDVQRKSDETATLHALAHLVDQVFDAQKLAASIAAAPVEAGSADAAWLALDGVSERLIQGEITEGPQVVAASRITASQAKRQVDLAALFDEVSRTQQPLVLQRARSDARVHAGPRGQLASLLVVPLLTRGVFVGALFAARNVARGFEKDDVSSIQAFASQAALALDHARLFEEEIEMERLERELDIARTVQQRLLPRRLPVVEGLELAAGSTPAREVGGDYYDFAVLDDGRLAFIVADVSGKGTSAAFYMAEMQGLFRSLSRLRPAPSAFLCHANEALRDILEEGTFVSALYGLLDPERRTLTLARAGHCPVAFARTGQAPRLLRPDGIGLGLASTRLFKKTLATERLPLRPGDTLALYTDGLVESRSTGGEEYGYDRLLRSLGSRGREAPTAVHDGLLGDLRAFTACEAYDDDLTLMVLQWHGPPAGGFVDAAADGVEARPDEAAVSEAAVSEPAVSEPAVARAAPGATLDPQRAAGAR